MIMVVARRSSKVVKRHFLYFLSGRWLCPGAKRSSSPGRRRSSEENHAWMDLTQPQTRQMVKNMTHPTISDTILVFFIRLRPYFVLQLNLTLLITNLSNIQMSQRRLYALALNIKWSVRQNADKIMLSRIEFKTKHR